MSEPLERYTPGDPLPGSLRSYHVHGNPIYPDRYGWDVDCGPADGWWAARGSDSHRHRFLSAFSPGRPLRFRVWRVDLGRQRLVLDYDRPDSTYGFHALYRPGKRARGVVRYVLPEGAFIELRPSGVGMLHRADAPGGLPAEGEDVEVFIKSSDLPSWKITFSLRPVEAPTPPWEEGTAGKISSLLFHPDPQLRAQGRELMEIMHEPALVAPLVMSGEVTLAARCLSPDPDAAMPRMALALARELVAQDGLQGDRRVQEALRQLAAGGLDEELLRTLHRRLWRLPHKRCASAAQALIVCANRPPAEAASRLAHLLLARGMGTRMAPLLREALIEAGVPLY